ncbi:MAG: LuxR C-terminal-related transcriptional regulator [Dehalococcoidia bacterium]
MDDEAWGHIERGLDGLRRWDWVSARQAFEQSVAIEDSPEAQEGLARACGWLHDELCMQHWERAFQLYRQRGDSPRAAMAAVWLANDLVDFRGAAAIADGWVSRARRLLDDFEPRAEHAWLALWDAASALMGVNDPAGAMEAARRAIALARQFGVADVEFTAMAIEGLALVSQGGISEGMRLVDEAAAATVAGDVDNPNMRMTILCSLMDACDRARDYERASQWSARIHEVARQWGAEEVFSACRPHYAVVLTWHGAWTEAEAQLTAAVRELSAIRPAMAIEGVVRLAELRMLQGRHEEAAALFADVEHEPLAQLGRGRLALEQGDPSMAIELAERYLRRIPVEDRIERVAGLDLLVRARIAAGQPAQAREPAAELRAIAEATGAPLLRAAACASEGLLAAAAGEHEAARRAFEESADCYAAAHAPFETARVRLDLARALDLAGYRTSALREIESALTTCIELGARSEAARARTLLAELAGQPATDARESADDAGLTARETEILRLIASGLSNRAIADELVLSVRTVERHISNLYGKLGVDGRTARAAVTAHAFRTGLLPPSD